MPFKVEEEFDVQAPVERVWEYLIAPAKVVVCLPGAELLESQDDRTFLGAVKAKVGPMAMSFKGVVRFTEVDEQAHQVRMVGEGREAGGAGSAKMTMLSKVTPIEGGYSRVLVIAEIDLVGKIVQFGRGMIEEVFKQLFKQFSACIKQQLEVPLEVRAEAVQSGETAPPVETKALSPVPLVLHALWTVIARFFLRLFGKKTG